MPETNKKAYIAVDLKRFFYKAHLCISLYAVRKWQWCMHDNRYTYDGDLYMNRNLTSADGCGCSYLFVSDFFSSMN